MTTRNHNNRIDIQLSTSVMRMNPKKVKYSIELHSLKNDRQKPFFPKKKEKKINYSNPTGFTFVIYVDNSLRRHTNTLN